MIYDPPLMFTLYINGYVNKSKLVKTEGWSSFCHKVQIYSTNGNWKSAFMHEITNLPI